MRYGKWVPAIWVCFFIRTCFYAAVLPVWEGYDEWGHFGTIRLVAMRGQALPPRDSPLPRDVGASLNLVPLPWAWRDAASPAVTHDQFWQLPPNQRETRETDFRVLPRAWQWEGSDSPYRSHEAYQPPLYYWVMAPLMRLLGGAGIARQLLAVRWFGALLASFTIPLTFRIARELLGDDRLAVGCAAVVAAMPGFALVAGHSGNDCLAAPIFALLIWYGVRIARGDAGIREQLALGAALGLGLLTKAYFLTAIPPVAALAIWKLRRRAVAPLGLALLLSGWWYARSYLQTGTPTGLTDFVMAGNAHAGVLGSLFAIRWTRAIDSIWFSHLYAGGWSFLLVRSWMYHVFYVVGVVGAVGLVRARRSPAMWFAIGIYLSFWIGELYHVVILWLARGVATSMGYYLYGVVAAEVPLCIAGLAALLPKRRAAWAPAAGVLLFSALDLFAMHARAIPYYTGLIRHAVNGALPVAHASQWRSIGFGELLQRMTAFRTPTLSPASMLLLWVAYWAATGVLVGIALRACRNSTSAAGFAAY